MLRLSFCLLSAMAVTAWADPQPVMPNAAEDRFRPLSLDSQKIAGLLGNRLRANQEGFLEHVPLRSLLQPFQTKTGNEGEGEFAGRFLQAASHSYAYTHDPQLKELMDKLRGSLLALQGKDGYFQTHSDGERWTSADLLVHKWLLLGLLSYWQATGDEDAYMASQMIGDLLVNTLGDKGTEYATLGRSGSENRQFRLAALQTLESLTALYRYTADPEYLDLCKSIVRAADVNVSSIVPRDKENLPDVLLSLVGLADLYRLTGDKAYLDPALRGWKALAGSLLLTGTPAPDSCATGAWMKLTLSLLRITGEPQYGQQWERTVYNQLFAAQDAHTGSLASQVALAGKKVFSSQLSPENGRCLLSGAEALASIPQGISGRYEDGIIINMFTAGRATVQLRRRGFVQLYAEGAFPQTGEMLLHVEPSHHLAFALSLRVPDWTSSLTADVAGQHSVGKRGELLTINREWKRGDIIRVSVAMDARFLNSPDEKNSAVAVGRGPQILALSKTLNPQIEDFSAVKILPVPARPKLPSAEEFLPASWQGDQAYRIDGEYEGKKQSLTMVPFADALNYQVWLEKTNGSGAAEE